MLLPIIFLVLFFALLFCLQRFKIFMTPINGSSLLTRSIYVVVFLFSTMFTMIVMTVFRPLQCLPQPDGTYSMMAAPSYQCFDKQWYTKYPFVILFSVIFVGILPIVLIIEFWKNKSNPDSLNFIWKYGSLLRPYRKKYFWWEIINTVKKTIFVILVDVLSDISIYSRLFYLICFLMLFLGIENTVKPFKNSRLNALNSS